MPHSGSHSHSFVHSLNHSTDSDPESRILFDTEIPRQHACTRTNTLSLLHTHIHTCKHTHVQTHAHAHAHTHTHMRACTRIAQTCNIWWRQVSWSWPLVLVWQLEKACGTKATEIEGQPKGESSRSKRTRAKEQERHRRRESERESISERALARMWAREWARASFLWCRQQISAATRWHWQGRGSHWAQFATHFATPSWIYFLSC